jgi:hypothetical protein
MLGLSATPSQCSVVTIRVGIRPFSAIGSPDLSPPSLSCTDVSTTSVLGGQTPPSVTHTKHLVRDLTPPKRSPCRISTPAKALVDAHLGRRGAGGNRTPVHQPVDDHATTVPDIGADAAPPAGRMIVGIATSDQRSGFPECQPSFRPPAVFPTVILRFCCRAAADRPRAAFLLTMSLHSPGIRRRERTARWQFLLLPRLASLSNSGRVPAPRY